MPVKCFFVSVIVPVYNGARTIASCLESLLVQDYPHENYEIIVIENGSSDDTTSIVEKYPIRLFHCERKGPAFARNFGVQRSQADIVAFTDSDCIADPQWLSKLLEAYKDDRILGAGGGNRTLERVSIFSFSTIFGIEQSLG